MKKKATNSEPCSRISDFVLNLNPTLFTFLETVTGALDPDQFELALVLEALQVEKFVEDTRLWGGRPAYSLKPTARALVAKAKLNIATTKALIARLKVDHSLRTLCGFDKTVPGASTFSRHFKAFAQSAVLDLAHESLVREHVGAETVHHVCRDSSAIKGREKPTLKYKRKSPVKKKRGRPSKGAEPVIKEPTRISVQLEQDFQTSLGELPRACDVGAKTNSKGHLSCWVGFKLHLDVSDGGLPLSAFTSSASVHDSQVAIPLSRMTSSRVAGIFYELMDRGYCAKGITEAIVRQGHVPIIQPTMRDKNSVPLDSAQAQRFKIRTTVERTFSDLKDNHGGRTIRVRGPAKVHTHLMFGVLTIFALVLIRAA